MMSKDGVGRTLCRCSNIGSHGMDDRESASSKGRGEGKKGVSIRPERKMHGHQVGMPHG